MNITVVGAGHLAEATRAECALHFPIVGLESESADLVWFCVDTPVGNNDVSYMEYVEQCLDMVLGGLKEGTPVLISSQVPVGWTRKMAERYPQHHLYCQPENIRKAHARGDFHFQNRMIVGCLSDTDIVECNLINSVLSKFLINSVLSKFTPGLIMWMSYESAEMVKHALNAFLAMEIAYANEIADICDSVGASRDDVFRGFRSDRRVGNGPLDPGGPFVGGTLGRDLRVLMDHTDEWGIPYLINAIHQSNEVRT